MKDHEKLRFQKNVEVISNYIQREYATVSNIKIIRVFFPVKQAMKSKTIKKIDQLFDMFRSI